MKPTALADLVNAAAEIARDEDAQVVVYMYHDGDGTVEVMGRKRQERHVVNKGRIASTEVWKQTCPA